MNLPFLRPRRDRDAENAQVVDRSDIALFNEARTDEERYRVIASVRARARARRG